MTPGPVPWPEIPMRNNSTVRARTLWHWVPRREVVTGTEDQSSAHSLICEKAKARESWCEGSSPAGALTGTQGWAFDTQLPGPLNVQLGQGAQPGTTVSSFFCCVILGFFLIPENLCSYLIPSLQGCKKLGGPAWGQGIDVVEDS